MFTAGVVLTVGTEQKNGSISMIEVKRDRQWFEDNLPRMEAWYTQLKEESERRDSPPPVQSAE